MSDINEELLYDMFNEGIYQIKIDNHGEVTDIEYEDDYFDYDSFIEYFEDTYDTDDNIVTAQIFDETQIHLNNLIYNARYYSTGRAMLLQLHDNHTAWNIDNENLTEADWMGALDEVIYQFENETGIEVFTEGRSGRHICVALTLENLEKYDELVAIALKYEKEFINRLNSVATEEF